MTGVLSSDQKVLDDLLQSTWILRAYCVRAMSESDTRHLPLSILERLAERHRPLVKPVSDYLGVVACTASPVVVSFCGSRFAEPLRTALKSWEIHALSAPSIEAHLGLAVAIEIVRIDLFPAHLQKRALSAFSVLFLRLEPDACNHDLIDTYAHFFLRMLGAIMSANW